MVKLRCPNLHSFGHTPRPPASCTVLIYPARSIWYRVQTGAACPAFGRVCPVLRGLPWYLPALVLARTALLLVMCGRSGCAGWFRGAPAGYIAAAQPHPVSPVTTEKIKKAQKLAAQFCATKNFPPQKQKDPYKGSVFCAILALQALKGRNLQWLKVK